MFFPSPALWCCYLYFWGLSHIWPSVLLMLAFYFALLTFCNPYKSKLSLLARCLAPLPKKKPLEHCLLCCLSLASLNGLAAVASSPTLHTVCLCDSLLADDLLVGALRRNISSFPGLFSHATAAALIPSERRERSSQTEAALQVGSFSPCRLLLD